MKDPQRINKNLLKSLQENPDKGVDFLEISYVTGKRSEARNIAEGETTKINLGLSDFSEEFPSSLFSAVYLEERKNSRYVVVLFNRNHTPREWKKFVNGA